MIFFLYQRSSLKDLIMAYTFIVAGALSIPVLSTINPQVLEMGPIIMEGWQWLFMILFNFLSSLYAILIIRIRKRDIIFRAKYILFGGMNVMITLMMLWAGSLWIFLGYILLTIMAGFFHDWKLPLYSAICACATFFIIIYPAQPFDLQGVGIWIIYLLSITLVTTLINRRNYVFLRNLLEKQQDILRKERMIREERDLLELRVKARTKELEELTKGLDEQVKQKTKEVEKERASLEVKVKTRTKELEELTKGLDEKVKQRTKELQARLDELEKFHRVTVGREVRMGELKSRIKELEDKLEK